MPAHKIQVASELVSAGPQSIDSAAAVPVSQQQRVALAVRIQSVVEREIAAVERVLDAVGAADGGEAERTARTLASISRTLREIAALNQPDEVNPPDEATLRELAAASRRFDDFVRELARFNEHFGGN